MLYSKDTQVLTRTGWSSILRKSFDSEIYDPIKGIYVPVEEVVSVTLPVMYSNIIHADKVDVSVLVGETSFPFILCKGEALKLVNDLFVDGYIPFAVTCLDTVEPTIEIGMKVGEEELKKTYDRRNLFAATFLASLLGTVKDAGKPGQKVEFNISRVPKDKQDECQRILIECADELGILYSKEADTQNPVYLDSVFAGFINNIQTGASSAIPFNILEEISLSMAEDLAEMLLHLGLKDIYLLSQVLTDQFQMLFIMAGMYAPIGLIEQKVTAEEMGIKLSAESRGNTFLKRTYHLKIYPDIHTAVGYRRKHVFSTPMEGPTSEGIALIVNATTPSFGYFRKNGKPFIGLLMLKKVDKV